MHEEVLLWAPLWEVMSVGRELHQQYSHSMSHKDPLMSTTSSKYKHTLTPPPTTTTKNYNKEHFERMWQGWHFRARFAKTVLYGKKLVESFRDIEIVTKISISPHNLLELGSFSHIYFHISRTLLPGFWLEPENLSISHQSSGPYTGFQLHLGLILKYFYSFISHSMV